MRKKRTFRSHFVFGPLFLIMRNSILFSILMLAFSVQLYAQKTTEDEYATAINKNAEKNNPKPLRDRLVFGGNLGGYFGNPTYLQVSPMLGYRTTPSWYNGIGLNYTFIALGGYRENMIGGSVWSRAYIAQRLIAHSEFEMLRREARDNFGNRSLANVPVWLVGAGYASGGPIGFSAMIMYDLIQDPNSPYSNPIIRLGGLFGF